jgi:hypothetical protein
LTDLNASNISAGTLNASRLPVPLELTSAAGAGSVITGYASSAAGATVGVTGNCESSGGVGVQGAAYGITGFTIGVEGRNFNSPTGTGVVGTANATGGFFEAYGTSGTGLFGINQSSTGSTYGVQGRVSSPNGTAIRGESTSTGLSGHGVVGVTQSSAGGIGVWGTHANSSGTGVGVQGETNSPTSKGVHGVANATTGSGVGVHGVSYGPQGYGVFGVSNATTGYSVGVQGEASLANPSGTGVVGKAAATGGYFAATGSGGTGVWGQSESDISSGTGVYGSTASPSGWGVVGSATSSTGICYGVYGAGPSSGWGVFAQGNLGASGSKQFRIDHPADPENKYLLHYSAESPEVINFYSGTIPLDGAGEAVVELPAYFASINKEPRYTLTAVGAPMPMLHIAEEISSDALLAGERAKPGEPVPACSFRIAGGAAGAKVSWEVKAVRNDAYVRQRGAPVETDKIGPERGTYQHPELYGQPPDRRAHHPSHEETTRLREAVR